MSVEASGLVIFWSQIKHIYEYFYPLEVVGRGSETQLEVGENLNEVTYSCSQLPPALGVFR